MERNRGISEASAMRRGRSPKSAIVAAGKLTRVPVRRHAPEDRGLSTAPELGAIKDLLSEFIRTYRDAPREQLELELRELHRFICSAGQAIGVDARLAQQRYGARLAKRRPKLLKR